jgi:deoxyribonuclease-1
LKSALFIIFMIFMSESSFSADVMSLKGNKFVHDFNAAKKLLPKLYLDHQETIYCGCKYYGKEVNMNSCNSSSEGQTSRYKKLEWEHVVPAARLGKVVSSWTHGDETCKNKKGRKCAEKASSLFRQMEGDLYNLWPESGGINQARSNKEPADEAEYNSKTFGSCQTKVGRKSFSPRKEIRGKIARTYLYMNKAYDLDLSEKQVQMFRAWNSSTPVDAWECERARRIKKLQGNANSFVEEKCGGT